MPDLCLANPTAIAKMSCCWIQRRTKMAMHLPCSEVSSMVAMMNVVVDNYIMRIMVKAAREILLLWFSQDYVYYINNSRGSWTISE